MPTPAEEKALSSMSVARYGELSEDHEGFLFFEELLASFDGILDEHATYAKGFHVEIKDYLGSFLPDVMRDKVVDDQYLKLVRRQDALVQDGVPDLGFL